MSRADLAEQRARFCKSLSGAPGVTDPRVISAFQRVSREEFVGPGPWKLLTPTGYLETASDDPALLYEDVVVALAHEKRINNGQPSLHARCLSAARIEPGDRVLHIGSGSGYYTAIIAELATSSGRVTAWDVEPGMAALAAENLRSRSNVAVSLRSGTASPIPASDVIYVSAGCTRPFRIWTDALPLGGRLLFPLTPGWDFGGMLLVTRQPNVLAARFLCACSFIPCVGGSDDAAAPQLRRAFERGSMADVSYLHFGSSPQSDAWFAGEDWWLSHALH